MHEIKRSTKRINGEDITTYSREVVSANILEVEAGTNGYHGGDAGHGSKTYLRIQDKGGTACELTMLDGGFDIVLYGDCELRTFIEALKFAVRVLEEESQGYE